jgi:hypothetical protein
VSAATQEPVVDLFLDLADDELAEIIRADIADVSPRELAEQLREACEVLEGLVVVGEALGMATFMLLSEARRRAHEARRRAEAYAGLPVSDW